MSVTIPDFYRVNDFRLHEIPSHQKYPAAQAWQLTQKRADDVEPKLQNGRYDKFGVILDDDHLVIDVDVEYVDNTGEVKHARATGLESLRKLEAATGYKLDDICGAIVKSPGGGLHYYFRKPTDLEPASAADDYPGLDFLSLGDQVVGAGSKGLKVDGRYEFLKADELRDIPSDLLQHLIDASSAKREPNKPQQTGQQDNSDKPGAEFNNSMRGLDLFLAEMKAAGYVVRDTRAKDAIYEWDRPNKGTESYFSGLIGQNTSGNYYLVAFSLSEATFPKGGRMSIFYAYAMLCHGGSLTKAADALYARGFAKPDASEVFTKLESDKEQEATPTPGITPIGIGQLIDSHPDMRPVIVDGILRRGETANIIAAAKVGKSFLAGNLAWSIATGVPWLGHNVTEGRVLIIDNELHPETLASRLYRIATDMTIDVRDYANAIDVISLRGQNVDIHHIESQLAAIEPGTYSLAVFDALYRTLPAGTSENDNAAMMAIYNRLDYYARAWDCAIAVVHHASKGQQGDKSVTDVGSGAGSISRAADTHIVIRPHEQPELSVLECVTRSFKSPEPVSVRFDWPLWSAVSESPQVKKLGARREEKAAQDDREADDLLIEALATNARLSESQIVRSTGMGPSRVSRAVGRAVAAGRIEARKVKRNGRKTTTYVQSATASATAK